MSEGKKKFARHVTFISMVGGVAFFYYVCDGAMIGALYSGLFGCFCLTVLKNVIE